ncbi:hypothetical protein [Gottfriedia acidiceleris]|uniref:hypothetical protein n=1 Tax=Gottfriedia acidiceleris TaxID=371036 RepID=UPI002FFE2A58
MLLQTLNFIAFLRMNIAPKNILVSGLHKAYMDTDMTANIKAPKSNPAEIAKIAIDGIEADSYEILADNLSRMVQHNFAGGVKAIYPQLF